MTSTSLFQGSATEQDSARETIPLRWTDVSDKPNSVASSRYRVATLNKAYHAPVQNRVDYLTEISRGKRVLDMGVVAHAVDKEQDEKWLHRPIAASASYCLGVDILKDEVEQLKQQGYNVRHCNILDSATDLGERFDVMIVGEVIEHLGSPEKLFEAAQRVLVPGGKLVMTTPNPYYWKRMRDSLRVKIPRCESADHVTYLYPSGIAEFAERAGMSLELFRGVYTYRSSKLLGRIGLWLKQLVGGRLLAREAFCNTMIYECTFRSEVAALRRAG